MTGIPYGWLAYAATNTAVGSALGAGLGAATAAGLGPIGAGALSLVLGTRSLLDLNAAYGPLAALLGPPVVTAASLASGVHSGAPAAASVALFVLAHSARKARA